ncbi:sigma-54 interaction domain-containing protein [Halobacillus faecis]|uniref:ATPase AAA n=1 Tax=Halobacillus faecis TaxID=360184 RepID=A0A511WU04_9BACI|nr:sigma 54-interacting transcriptional regulator [Halobacillus faecis]GEN54644.1 ATPase AAA [Halobacillus faecis]
MRTISVISLGENTLHSVVEQLRRYLGEEVEVRGFSLERGMEQTLDDEVVVLTGVTVYRLVYEKVQTAKKVIIARRALRYEFIEPLLSIKENENVLLVNDTEESCTEAIDQLKRHGFDSFTYHPYFPGMKEYTPCPVAITPGEPHLIPKRVQEVIDIGTRQMDITTITEVLVELGVLETSGSLASAEYVKDIMNVTKHLSTLNQRLDYSNFLTTTILDKFPKALLFCNEAGEITYFNEKMTHIFQEREMQEFGVQDLFGDDFVLTEAYSERDHIVHVRDMTLITSVEKIEDHDEVITYLLEVENYDTFQQVDRELRKKLKSHAYTAQYKFEHLHTRNPAMKEMIGLAKTMARGHSTILIQGESGTGKEILAQSIHNESARSKRPFVAVNLAALSSSILESELFGYESGAFTGAHKRGRKGLFEEAHTGTIFMDEIGDAPLELQVKLLRVLQEGAVRKVGGTEQVPVDIRIIAATNKDLEQRVREGTFRRDLYYRLNILPIETLPLRERREDILPLVQYYLNHFAQEQVYGLSQYIDEGAISFLESHPWPGNVRELMNVVEFIVNMRSVSGKLTYEELPAYIKREGASDQGNRKADNSFMLSEEEEVLLVVYQKFGIGRRKIVEELKQKGIHIGEGKVKSIIHSLKYKGWIDVNKGIRGCTITEEGRIYVKENINV